MIFFCQAMSPSTGGEKYPLNSSLGHSQIKTLMYFVCGPTCSCKPLYIDYIQFKQFYSKLLYVPQTTVSPPGYCEVTDGLYLSHKGCLLLIFLSTF